MVPLRVILYTVYTYVIVVFLALVYIVPALIIVCIPERYRFDSKLVYWFVYSFYCLAQKVSFLSIAYKGLEHIPTEPAIFAANHQSSLDIPLMGSLVGVTPHVWLARQDVLDDFWFIGFIIRQLAVMVDVTTPRAGMLSLLRITHLVQKRHCHIMIFPEGGRFVNGAVNDFYGGFVILARRLNRPIIPVYIDGVHKVYPPNSWWARWGRIVVTVGAPMFPHTGEADTDFKKRVHQWFLDQVR
jgi:1-acyl-sn-glycerol-3-phosphate acyltransferase